MEENPRSPKKKAEDLTPRRERKQRRKKGKQTCSRQPAEKSQSTIGDFSPSIPSHPLREACIVSENLALFSQDLIR